MNAVQEGGVQRELVQHPLCMRELEVKRLRFLSPRMVRVTLGGEACAGFQSLAPDDHIKVLFPPPGQQLPTLPKVVQGRVQWPRKPEGFVARDYTPVHYDAGAQELELDIVLHQGGHATAWVQQAVPGAVLGVAGPRGSHVFPQAPGNMLLLGDETALPAIERFLAEMPASSRITAHIEVQDRAERRTLASRASVHVHWLERRAAEPGTTSLLLDSLRAQSLPQPLDHCWLAGEADTVQALRRYLLEQGVPRSALTARGYWKRGERDHQEPHDD